MLLAIRSIIAVKQDYFSNSMAYLFILINKKITEVKCLHQRCDQFYYILV